MRGVVLYIAMSLDGFIADEEGCVDWLCTEDGVESTGSWEEFSKTFDTMIMGWNTYHQVRFELSPDEWEYKGYNTYVIIHRDAESGEGITFIHDDPCFLIERLRRVKSEKNIWICGGASLVRQLLDADLIDLFHISIIPVILGNGIRLFPSEGMMRKLHLSSVSHEGGIVELSYERNKNP